MCAPPRNRLGVLPAILILGCIALAITFEVTAVVLTHPGVPFLLSEHGARWIRHDEPPKVIAQTIVENATVFRKRFSIAAVPSTPMLMLRSMRGAAVLLDGQQICSIAADPPPWRRTYQVDLSNVLTPGEHEVRMRVTNAYGPPCLLAYSDALGLHTDSDWEASTDGRSWSAARRANQPRPFDLSREFTRADLAVLDRLAVYAPIFLLVAALTMWGRRVPFIRDHTMTPRTVRWMLLIAWAALAVNNLIKLPLGCGFDLSGHVEYVQYVAEHWRIPLATEGWQMFQSPLYYVVTAPFALLAVAHWNGPGAIYVMRVLPLLSGWAQVEICFRLVRRLFPTRNDLQILGTLFGGLLPMNIYISSYPSNEAPAGFLTGAAILMATGFLISSREAWRWRPLLGIGLVLGAAMLTKMTPVMLIPPLVLLIGYAAFAQTPGKRKAAVHFAGGASMVLLLVGAICGWYYCRNYIELGRPFIGGWQSERGIAWWQDPGYRMPRDFLCFGEALFHPAYAALFGFWNGLYSTLWMDGFLGGTAKLAASPPWNYEFLLGGMWLALLPTAAIVLGVLSTLRRPLVSAQSGMLFIVVVAGVYFAGLVFHFLTNPNYCATKAFYAVGITCCLAALCAAGFDLLTCRRVPRAVVYGLFACWIASAYAGHFIW